MTLSLQWRHGPLRNRSRRALLLGTALGAGLALPAWSQVAAVAEEEAEIAPFADDGSLVLDAIEVTAAPGTVTEDTGSWTTEWLRSATGLVLPQKETPQSTSVLTQTEMKDREITSIREVMDAATGITVQAFESDRVNFYSRGFLIDSYQYDGVPTQMDTTWQYGDANLDMAIYDHVSIVRGATGLMTGAGTPGASINFIRKRPTQDVRRETAILVGTPTAARTELDLSGPLTGSGRIRGRLIGAAEYREGWLDDYETEKWVGYGVVDADLTDSTLLTFGLSRQQTNPQGVTWGGIPPWTSDFELVDWPWGTTVGADWTEYDTTMTEAFAEIEHVFDNGWTARVTATHLYNEFDSKLLWLFGLPDPVTGEGMGTWAAHYTGERTQDSLNAVLNGDFEALGRVHQFVVGAFASRYETENLGYPLTSAVAPAGNFFEWDGSIPEPTWGPEADPAQTWKTVADQYAVYGSVQFRATDALAIIAGARLNWWDGTQTDPGVEFNYDYFGAMPYFGATYDLNETYTLYASFTTIYDPQLVQDIDGDYLDPTWGYNYEAGVKASLFEGQLLASAAVFQTDQKNLAVEAGSDPTDNSIIWEAVDGVTTRGFELEAAGAISDRWNLSAGYTYRYSEDRDGNEQSVDQPNNTLKLATDYRIAGILDERLTVGGAMRWQSATDSMPWDGTVPNIVQDAYAVFDASARYDLTEDMSVQLNVTNLLDENVLPHHRLLQHGGLRRRHRRRTVAARPVLTFAGPMYGAAITGGPSDKAERTAATFEARRTSCAAL